MADSVKKYNDRCKELESNRTVVRPIPRLKKGRLTVGNKYKYTPVRMRNGINKYFEWCENTDNVPSITGMMIHLGMMKQMFYKYLGYPDFTDMMEHARLIIKNWAEDDVYRSKGMAAGKIAYMKNLHGWSDKLETKNESTVVQVTPEQARLRIEQLAPQLLEVLQSENMVKQITAEKEAVDAEVVEEPTKAK